MIKTGTRFTYHLSKRPCTRMVSFKSERVCTSSVVERGWKSELWKIWLRRKGKNMTHCRSVIVGENPRGGGRGRGFQEHRTGQAANVDDIRGLHAFVGTHLNCRGEDPTSNREAMNSAQRKEWVTAMKKWMHWWKMTHGNLLIV